jgi:uncharacterized BrkB/YihY/UPF0761 family membrane protein
VYALVWEEPPGRQTRPLQASLAFTGVGLAICADVAASWWLKGTVGWGAVGVVIALVGPLAAIWVRVSLALPHRGLGWKSLLPGALLVAVGFQAVHVLVLWLAVPKLQSSSSTYGPLGIIAVLLFWGYLVGRLIVSAPIVNASLHDERHAFRPEQPTSRGSP